MSDLSDLLDRNQRFLGLPRIDPLPQLRPQEVAVDRRVAAELGVEGRRQEAGAGDQDRLVDAAGEDPGPGTAGRG